MIGRPPRSPFSPYTPLFRSDLTGRDRVMTHERSAQMEPPLDRQPGAPLDLLCHDLPEQVGLAEVLRAHNDPVGRSEEHTSELQSQSNLVCRLLLEKKKQIPH